MVWDACTSGGMVWPQMRNEEDLVSAEDAAFTSLVQRRARFVFRVAYAVLLNSHDAEDVVQETFLKLYRNGGWRNAENEQAFLARVAWRAAVDARRRSASQPPESASGLHWDEGAASESEPASPRPGPEAIAVAANRHAVVHAAIDSLPEELRVPLVLSSFEELNSREIGGILGVPDGTVRTRLQRARQMLRRKLAGLEGARYV